MVPEDDLRQARCHTHVLHRGKLATVADVQCDVPTSPPGPERHASAHQLVFVRTGVFLKHDGARGQRTLVAEPAHVLLVNRDEPYRTSHPADGGDACTTLTFPAAVALDAVRSLDRRAGERPGTPFSFPHAPLTAEAALSLRALRRLLRPRMARVPAAPGHGPDTAPVGWSDGIAAAAATAGRALRIEEEALSLLARVLRDGYSVRGVRLSCRRADTARGRRELVERAKAVLAADPGRRHTLAELAGDMAISPFHLTRVFREITGMPMHQYLLRLRLATSLERLDAGDTNLSALALALGFSSHSHFSAAFRKAFGITPTEFSAQRTVRTGALRDALECARPRLAFSPGRGGRRFGPTAA